MTSREIFEYGLTRRTPEELQAHPDFSHVTRRRIQRRAITPSPAPRAVRSGLPS